MSIRSAMSMKPKPAQGIAMIEMGENPSIPPAINPPIKSKYPRIVKMPTIWNFLIYLCHIRQ